MRQNNSRFALTFIPNSGYTSEAYIRRVEEFLKLNGFIDRFDPSEVSNEAILCRVKYHPTEISEFIIENQLDFKEFIVKYYDTDFEMSYKDWIDVTNGFRVFDNLSYLGIIIEFILETLKFE